MLWDDPPGETKSFALIMHDPDAPHGDVTHWLLWDLPAFKRTLGEDDGRQPGGATGCNEHGEISYLPPTPPKGDRPHRYLFELFALDVSELGLPLGTSREPLETALNEHALGVAQLVGTFGRGKNGTSSGY